MTADLLALLDSDPAAGILAAACRECARDGVKLRRGLCGACYARWLYRQPASLRRSDSERFAGSIKKTPGGCWIWTGARTTKGYGQFRHEGVRVLAHRYSYEIHVGPIPEGLTLDHLCRNHPCVNPAHLEPVTMAENLARGTSPTAINGAKTHCIRRHPFDEANTWIEGNGRRHCRTCARNRYRRKAGLPIEESA